MWNIVNTSCKQDWAYFCKNPQNNSILQIESDTFIIWQTKLKWLSRSQMYFKRYTRNEYNCGSWRNLLLCNKCYYSMMLYILIVHYDLFASSHHGVQESETQDYLARIEYVLTPVLNRVLHWRKRALWIKLVDFQWFTSQGELGDINLIPI